MLDCQKSHTVTEVSCLVDEVQGDGLLNFFLKSRIVSIWIPEGQQRASFHSGTLFIIWQLNRNNNEMLSVCSAKQARLFITFDYANLILKSLWMKIKFKSLKCFWLMQLKGTDGSIS